MSASGRLSFAFQAAVRGPACQRHSLWSGHVRAGAGGLMRHPSCSGQGARGGRWVCAMHNDAHAKPAMQFRSARWTCTATAWRTLLRCRPCGAKRPGVIHNGHAAPCHFRRAPSCASMTCTISMAWFEPHGTPTWQLRGVLHIARCVAKRSAVPYTLRGAEKVSRACLGSDAYSG